jgi:hypothetical protein
MNFPGLRRRRPHRSEGLGYAHAIGAATGCEFTAGFGS